jgi:hypothetical protein
VSQSYCRANRSPSSIREKESSSDGKRHESPAIAGEDWLAERVAVFAPNPYLRWFQAPEMD